MLITNGIIKTGTRPSEIKSLPLTRKSLAPNRTAIVGSRIRISRAAHAKSHEAITAKQPVKTSPVAITKPVANKEGANRVRVAKHRLLKKRVDGVFFLTNPDGSARRCTACDTVVLPKGW